MASPARIDETIGLTCLPRRAPLIDAHQISTAVPSSDAPAPIGSCGAGVSAAGGCLSPLSTTAAAIEACTTDRRIPVNNVPAAENKTDLLVRDASSSRQPGSDSASELACVFLVFFPKEGVTTAAATKPAVTAEPTTSQGCCRAHTRTSATLPRVSFISCSVWIIAVLASAA